MTLQPQQIRAEKLRRPILCPRCGAEVVFSNNKLGPNGRKIPLDPWFNNEPHQDHCIYLRWDNYDTDTEPLLYDFLSMIPNRRPKRIIGAVGRAK